ncbi:nitrate reductase molybdenum cofactor assembly chaperone [Paramicrobacterium agarici]|uniref:Respiratory nitrate reductase chaperone NarJ n=1 Tax=Paramicrobacterium agarici TaxID=630514 RepID=A0A2A9DUU8_9MICO|nr:nitrate reductase molybdenum cofactor assembly chaperone [Microbacterium agarici]PFG30557.1 respiratory nitrate reductase chaperone NarJ [Microbacterium agarici]
MSPVKPLPEPVPPLELTADQRRIAHMAASILLDYPDEERRSAWPAVADAVSSLPVALEQRFRRFLTEMADADAAALEQNYVATFDLKRKSAMYLTYYAAGDTRRRGMALVRFIEAYRAAGWEPGDEELPDYLPAVLEFSAASASPVAVDLLAAHRDGIEVLRAALAGLQSPYVHLIEAVAASLPEIDAATRERYLSLVNEGPPTETVGLTFLGNLKPYSAREEVGA